MRPFFFSFLTGVLFGSLLLNAQEIDFEKAAGSNIGRLETEDGDVEEVFNDQLGDLGATVFNVTFDEPGEATFALYTPKGQLVRILGQVIPVQAREYRIRWDGLDLFGNLIPAGTPLELKTFFNPGITVSYEMAITPPRVAPWPGTFTGNDNQPRFGGWLGDHSTPHGATAVGDIVFLGYKLAEAGNNLVGVNPGGEVVWTHKLEGWGGPSLLNSNGESIAALNSKGTAVYRIEPELAWNPKRDRWEVRKQRLIGGSGFKHLTVHGDDLLVIGEQKTVTSQRPHPRAFGNRDIDFIKSIPQVLNSTPPSDFHISPQTAFGNVFTQGGSPQVGVSMVPHEGYAFVMLVLKSPVEVGSIVIPNLGDEVSRIEVLTLKAGVDYQESMAPTAGKGSDDLMSLTLNTQGTEWVQFGSSDLKDPLNWIVSEAGTVKTQAVLIKAIPRGRVQANWKPRLNMARIQGHPLRPAASTPPSLSTDTRMKSWNPGAATPTGWRGTTEYPISDTYPMRVVQTYDSPITFNTLVAQDALHPTVFVDTLREGVNPDQAAEEDWTEIGSFRRSYNKKIGNRTASRHFYERYLQLDTPVTTHAIRYRMQEGTKGGKWGESKDNPMLTEAEHVQPLLAAYPESETPEDAPTHQLIWVDFASGETHAIWSREEYSIGTFDFAPDGTLYAVANGRLNTVDWDRETGAFSFRPLGTEVFDPDHTLFMEVDKERIAVSDSNAHGVRIFDRKGNSVLKIGTGTYRKPGPWNPNVLDRPRGIALPSTGDIWVAENSFAPKRVSQFSRDGRFKAEYLGPPMYGGGGRLDADGERMFYRGMEFHYDFKTGSSHLAGLYDRPYAENTPDAQAFTFGGTRYSNPVTVNGKRYLVGGGVIARKPDGVSAAIPAVVYGYASEHAFLQHEVWRAHWATQNLKEKFFVWCDRNGDGAYQVEEVEITDASTLPKGVGGGTVGPGLSLWGKHFRWSPTRFTPEGVPIFEASDIGPFDYEELAPHYSRNYTLSGKTSAKPMYGGFRYVSTDGYLAQEGQPFVVQPDGAILGGAPPKPSDYIPEIPGQRVQTAWSWAGGAMTDSPVGEIAIINSYKGAWHIWAVKHGVMLGRFFTGEDGTFSGLDPVRGMDVTKRYMGWEGWHADFVKTRQGRYLAQGGKTFHSINEVHGLDGYQIKRQLFEMDEKGARFARNLRPTLKARFEANQGNRLPAYIQRIRLQRSFQLDGLIEDWGDRGQFTFLDEKERTTRFDLSYNNKGLLVAIDGRGSLTGGITDWKQAVSEGFAIDLQIRRSGKRLQSNPNVIPGDTRIFITKLNGDWRGILYRPLTGTGPVTPFQMPSPYLDLNAEEFRLLAPGELEIRIRENALDVDVLEIGGEDGGFDLGELGGGLMLESEKSGGETKQGSGQNWTAELLLPWDLIGGGGGTRRFDIGIREAGSTGRRFYWNNAYPGPREEAELHLHPNPRAWGVIDLQSRKE